MLTPIELPNGRKIGDGEPCFIVAEIGQNHQGDVYTAQRLMTAARDAGVDGIKLCKRHLPSDMTEAMAAEPYNGSQSFGTTYGEHRAALELTAEDYAHLKDRMRYNEQGEILFATVCDKISMNEIEASIDPPMYKIASRDLDNLPLLEHVAWTKKPVILSAGMGSLRDIRAAVILLCHADVPVVLCYCVSQYPTPDALIRLGKIAEYRDEFDVQIGYSDHTAGITMAQTAAVLGAVYVEKHITLARAMKGSDHAASLEPDGMKRLVRNIRAAEAAMGPGPEADVSDVRRKLGRSICAARDIPAGTVITEEMLCLKSPGNGVPWSRRNEIVGNCYIFGIRKGTMVDTVVAGDISMPIGSGVYIG